MYTVVTITRSERLFLAGGEFLAGFAQGDGGQALGVGVEIRFNRAPMLLDAFAQQPGDGFGDALVLLALEAVNQSEGQLKDALIVRFGDGRGEQDQGRAAFVDVVIKRKRIQQRFPALPIRQQVGRGEDGLAGAIDLGPAFQLA